MSYLHLRQGCLDIAKSGLRHFVSSKDVNVAVQTLNWSLPVSVANRGTDTTVAYSAPLT